MNLPEEDESGFDLFIRWLYSKRAPPIPVLPEHASTSFDEMLEQKWLEHELPWHRLLCIGAKFCSEVLQASALCRLMEYHLATRTVTHPELFEFDLDNAGPTAFWCLNMSCWNFGGLKAGLVWIVMLW